MRKLISSSGSCGTCVPLANNINNKRLSVNSSLTVNDLRKITKTLGFRVPLLVYLKYMKLDEEKKEAIKLALISLIENNNKIEIRQEQSVTILNMPVNINLIKNENKQEAKQEGLDPELTKEYVSTLKEELRRAKEIIKRKNEELRLLRKLLDRVRMFARHKDIYNIRRVLGVA